MTYNPQRLSHANPDTDTGSCAVAASVKSHSLWEWLFVFPLSASLMRNSRSPRGARGGGTLVSAETTRSASERRAVLDEVEQGEGGKVSPQWSEAVQTAAAQMRENERGSDPETQESAFAAFCAIGAAAARTAERSHERERQRTPYRRCPVWVAYCQETHTPGWSAFARRGTAGGEKHRKSEQTQSCGIAAQASFWQICAGVPIGGYYDTPL